MELDRHQRPRLSLARLCAPLLLPRTSVKVAARSNRTTFILRSARRARRVSFTRSFAFVPGFARPFPLAIVRLFPSRLAVFFETTALTLILHASSQVAVTGMKPRFSTFFRFVRARASVPCGGVLSGPISGDGAESAEEVLTWVALIRERSRWPTSAAVGE